VLRIRRVEIDGFRSIKTVVFEPTRLCAVVGANNAGKSNVLSALDLLLGHRYPTHPALQSEDFYNCDPDNDLRVRAVFEYSEGGWDDQEMILEFGPQGGGGSDELKLRAWGEGLDGRYPQRGVRDRFPLIRLGIDRGLRQHEPRNRWTLLGRLLMEINDEFKGDPARMEEFTDTLTRLRDDVLGSVPSFQELLRVLREESARQIHREVEDVSVDLSLHDPWNFYRTLQIVVRESGMTQRADQMGMGLQSSLAIALLRAYARIARQNRAVIAIEEPELFLHPLAERQFYALMRDLAYPPEGSGREPLQIIYTTHSGNMISVEHFDEIALVRKERDEEGDWATTIHQATVDPLVTALTESGVPNVTSESVRARLRTTFDRSRTEGIFASMVILVEGASEELALPVYALGLGYDLDALNIAVINANGKQSMPLLIRVFEQLEVPWFAVFDGDAHQDEDEGNSAANRQLLFLAGEEAESHPETGIGPRHAVWHEDFERQLRSETSSYGELEQEAGRLLGKGKPVAARYCADALVARDEVPASVQALFRAVAVQAGLDASPTASSNQAQGPA
jgi:putative ATP-dependent endonuclease of OLD family